MKEGYLQNKIREQSDEINKFKKEFTILKIDINHHKNELEREKGLFENAIRSLDIKKAVMEASKTRMNELILPALKKARKQNDVDEKKITNLLDKMGYDMTFVTQQMILTSQVLFAFMKVFAKNYPDVFFQYADELKNTNYSESLTVFEGCKKDTDDIINKIKNRVEKDNIFLESCSHR